MEIENDNYNNEEFLKSVHDYCEKNEGTPLTEIEAINLLRQLDKDKVSEKLKKQKAIDFKKYLNDFVKYDTGGEKDTKELQIKAFHKRNIFKELKCEEINNTEQTLLIDLVPQAIDEALALIPSLQEKIKNGILDKDVLETIISKLNQSRK